jgi:hypothetical protein
MISLSSLMGDKLKKVSKKKSLVLPERFMQDAKETFDLFKPLTDLPYMAYFRLFQRNTARREEIISIRTWVRSHGNRGSIFFGVCRKSNIK